MNRTLSTLPAHHRGLLDFFATHDSEQVNLWKDIVGSEMTTTELYEEIGWKSGFRPAQPVLESNGLQFDTFTTPFTKKFYPGMYQLAFEYSPKAAYNDVYNLYAKIREDLAYSFYIGLEQSAASILTNGTSASYTGIDGVSLASASHPTKTTTYSNISTSATMSPTSFETMVQDTRNHKAFQDYSALIPGPWKIVCNPANEMIANRILQSQGQALTTNNDKNVVRGSLSKVSSNVFLTNTAPYWLIPEGSRNPIFRLKGLPRQIWETKNTNGGTAPSYQVVLFEEWTFGWKRATGIQYNAGS